MVKSSKIFYSSQKELVKRWKGYRLNGIDGSSLNLPDNELIRAAFGVHKNQSSSTPQARTVCRYDVLNDIVCQASIGSLKAGETKYATSQLDDLEQDVLSIYDRNFPGFAFIYEHQIRNLQFVMRCKIGFNKVVKSFVSSGKQSEIVDFFPSSSAIKNLREQGHSVDKNTSVKVRLERIELDNGETEILVTSLLDTATFTNADLSWVYNKRWGSETNFDSLKNKLEIELFTGQKPASILQDFYATIFAYNLNAILNKECDSEIEEINERRELNYKVNRNVSIGTMKPMLVKLLFTADEKEIIQILQYLKANLLKTTQPIRPNRKYPRRKRRTGGRNKVRPLTNYKRAS